MYCKKCGQPIDDNASFCEHCGEPVQRQYSAPDPVYQEQTFNTMPDDGSNQYNADPYQQNGYDPNGYQQPMYNTMPGSQPMVKGSTYLIWSILVTLFCCLPLGIPAIVFAAKIDSLNAQGRFAEAADSARKSKNFMIWGVVLTVVFTILYVILMVVTGIGLSDLYY